MPISNRSRHVLGALMAGTGALVVGAALAQGPMGGPAGPSYAGGPHFGISRLFTDMDANKDGKVTRAEVESFTKARAAEIDADKDGKITPAELRAFIDKQRERRIAERLARADKDGDGTVTVKEFEEAANWYIARFDRNGDGVIEKVDPQRGDRRHYRRSHGHDGYGRH